MLHDCGHGFIKLSAPVRHSRGNEAKDEYKESCSMSVSAVSPSIPMKPPEASVLKPPEVRLDRDDRTPLPPVRAALPPGQGTRIDQIA